MKILIAMPALNEEKIIEKNVLETIDFCNKNLQEDWEIVIADNKSSDRTGEIGKKLEQENDRVKYLYIDEIGKGIAIKKSWANFSADIYLFMDADLATDLSALPETIKEMKQGNDLVVGSRYHKNSKVYRSILRKFFSAGYRFVLKSLLGVKISDAPCGFKAVNQKVKDQILPLVKNNKWFFDSELLILSEKKGFKIKEIPVKWEDPREGDDSSRVKAVSLSVAYFKEVLDLKKRLK